MSTEATIQLALQDIRTGRFSSTRKAAAFYSLPRSTLQDRINGRPSRQVARATQQTLSPRQEETLAKWCLDLDAMAHPPNHAQIRELASLLLRISGGPDTLGKNWVPHFLRRHPHVKTRQRYPIDHSATKPQYSRSQSLRSASATNEYFTDYASDASSIKSHKSNHSGYETPPSRISSPIPQPDPTAAPMTLPARPEAARPPPVDTKLEGTATRRSRMLTSFDDMSPPTPGVDDTPYIRFAIEQLSADEEVMGHGRHGSVLSNDTQGVRYLPSLSEEEEAPLTSQPVHDDRQPRTPTTPQRPISRRPVPDEILLPVYPPEGQVWAELGFIPFPLRFWPLLTYIFLCLLVIAGLLFSNIFALRGRGLYDYDGYTTPRYFVFQYLPQMLGTILILWLFVIEAAIYRTVPYLSMTAPGASHTLLQDSRILPSNFVLPDLSWFKIHERSLGVSFVVFWLANFTIPLLSCLYQTKWIINHGPDRWRWTTVQGVGWTLFVLYLFLVVALFLTLFRIHRGESGLMWDPVCLADLIVLFQKGNVLADFERTEIDTVVGENLPPRSLRLGYWTTSQRPDIFYTVGEEKSSVNRLSVNNELLLREKSADSQNSSFDIERQRYSYASSFTRSIHSPFVRYRWVPWFVRDGAVLAWGIVAICLIIAFLVVSYVNRAVELGFLPLLPSRTDSGGFSSANFLYSFLPALLGTFLFLAWQPIDTYFRAVQPFANLARPTGDTADRTILSSYNACYPGEAVVQALGHRDFKVAYIALISLVSATLPVLAGGVFTAQLFPNGQVRMVASMPGYIGLSVLVTIYALSYLAIWPTRKRYLPHAINTIADQLSFLYASPLLAEPSLSHVRTKADLVARLVGAPLGLTGDSRMKGPTARYAFGIYLGRDGREHLGIDRLSRADPNNVHRDMLIMTGARLGQ
ncbi:hypothetical protein DV735_g2882, partial [Chaetothyriales sp. CBS 134920]